MQIWTVHPSHLDAKGLVALRRKPCLPKRFYAAKPKATGITHN